MGMLKFFFTILSITCAGLIIYGCIHVFIIMKRSKAREENARKIFLSKIQQAQSSGNDRIPKANGIDDDTKIDLGNDKFEAEEADHRADDIENSENYQTLKDFFSC